MIRRRQQSILQFKQRKAATMRPYSIAAVLTIFSLQSDGFGQAGSKPRKPRLVQSTVIDLTPKASSDWILKRAQRGTAIFSDRDYTFLSVPKEIAGGTVLQRDAEGSKSWLEPQMLTARKDCTVYAIMRWKYLGKEVINEATFTKFAREGWEDQGEIETSFPRGEDWRWRALSKSIKEGAVVLQLRAIKWDGFPVLFVFKEGKADAAGGAEKKDKKPSFFQSTVIDLTSKAPSDWILKEAQSGTAIFTDCPYTFLSLPKEIAGGTLVLRDVSGSKSWLEPRTLTALKAGTVYAIVRWKYLGKDEIDEVAFTKLAREGWEEVKGDVETTFPNGEDWRWKALSKSFKESEVVLQLKTINWDKAAVLFIFKEGK
jgi:hypothetical protein